MTINNFSKNITKYKRRTSSVCKVGTLEIGGENDIIIQSMANTDTKDTEGSVLQAISISNAGAKLVRFTAQGITQASNLGNIKKELINRNCHTPIVADIHYNANAAFTSAKLVDKVRINPGNFAEKDNQFDHTKFRKLIHICNDKKTAIRIGTNHGSLSPRIIDKYGDTAKGMVEATMEYLKIAKEENFTNLVISLKSSSSFRVVKAVRLLVERMNEEQMNFPLHLGVTEAGNGKEGRIKSSVGISTILLDGLGDTIRVSLTEKPEAEIPIAESIISNIKKYEKTSPSKIELDEIKFDFCSFDKYQSLNKGIIGGDIKPIVVGEYPNKSDFLYINENSRINKSENYIVDYQIWNKHYQKHDNCYPYFSDKEQYYPSNSSLSFIGLNEDNFSHRITTCKDDSVVFVLEGNYFQLRTMILKLIELDIHKPTIIKYSECNSDIESFEINCSCNIGGIFVDKLSNGIWISNSEINKKDITELSFNILQAAGVRRTKTEFISCPGCGRTQYNLEEITNKVKKEFSHLNHLKIAVMGCIVNGPGEMGDADYGYVGSKPNYVCLYKEGKMVKKDIHSDNAIAELKKLIIDCGDWI
ncbi:MAG: (E)-4-hydroxy-3-methylbut-2-enyl-diphosphate synthase [Marinifilaceae bacterium]|jgi:(E)-4-hydroxy-3-methylbut-2-enyl-diphosphate synthase|nr:(E)-4-hydroxy-3-methylbut-2-enyl-diphosphate synthase [Marinifilaceae bacterium]